MDCALERHQGIQDLGHMSSRMFKIHIEATEINKNLEEL